MFGRDRSAKFKDMAVNEAADIFAMSAQPRRAVSPFGRLDMVVDITVAEVTEGQGADAGESRGETARIFGDEARHQVRSEERRVGKERVSRGRSRGSTYHEKKKTT